jgi:hypothetical protein
MVQLYNTVAFKATIFTQFTKFHGHSSIDSKDVKETDAQK